MKDYKRLTNNNLEEYNPEYDFCVGCKYFGEPNGCNRPNGTCDDYERFNETYNRLAELEDKIESGELCDRKETVREILKPLYNVIMEHSDCCVNLSEDIKFLMEKYGIDLENEE